MSWLYELKSGDKVIVELDSTKYRHVGIVMDEDHHNEDHVSVEISAYDCGRPEAARGMRFSTWYDRENGRQFDTYDLLLPYNEVIVADLDRHNLQAEMAYSLKPDQQTLTLEDIAVINGRIKNENQIA